jgi:hypothetical protein
MAVTEVNLVIQQGEDFEASFDLIKPDNTVVGLSSYTALATLRKYPNSEMGYQFSTTLNIVQGKVIIGMANTITEILSPGRHYYDIFLVNNGKRYKAVEGNALVNSSATRI